MKLLRNAFLALTLAGCSTMGSHWMAEPLTSDYEPLLDESAPPPPPAGQAPPPSRVISGDAPLSETDATTLGRAPERPVVGGRSLGTFRNTYYDFPSEADFEGPSIGLKNAECNVISAVPRAFFESLCVQGSGTLRKGATVSFARRDCECAEVSVGPRGHRQSHHSAPERRGRLRRDPARNPDLRPRVRRRAARSRPAGGARRLLHRSRSRAQGERQTRRRVHRPPIHHHALEPPGPEQSRRDGRRRQPALRAGPLRWDAPSLPSVSEQRARQAKSNS
jgi:hypothetical protein